MNIRDHFRIGVWENVKLGRNATLVALILIIGAIVAGPYFIASRWQHILIMWCLWSIAGISWLVILKVGEFSLCSAAFLCIGAYSSSVMTLKLGCPFWPALIAGGLISGIFALALGVVVFRLKGLYFLVITYLFAEMLRLGISLTGYLGGGTGLYGMPEPGNIGFITFSTKQGWFYLSFLLLLITAFTFRRVEASRIGRVYSYIGMAPDLAESLGVRIMKYKVQAFVLGGIFTGLAGVVMAHYFTGISPESFTLYPSLVTQLVAILGGVPYLVAGPVVGAIIYSAVDEYVAAISGLRPLIVGVLLVVIIFFMPQGIISRLRQLFGKGREAKS